jgi:hypothetical protein
MYCPTCFNDTLKLNSRGVIKLAFNGKSKDTSLLLFNLQKETVDEVRQGIVLKIEELFKWFSTFQTKDPIKSIEIYSNDYNCSNNCKIPLNVRISITGILISQHELKKVAEDFSKKYQISVQFKG